MSAKRNIEIFLKHILENMGKIEDDTANLSQTRFFKSPLVQDAITRRLEIIGEAVKNLPDSFRKKYPQIPWKKIAGMRDVLIHEYFGVDMKLIWKIIEKDVPKLKKQISNLRENL